MRDAITVSNPITLVLRVTLTSRTILSKESCVTFFLYPQFDPTGQSAPCYDPTPSHAPGFGSYMWHGFRSLLEQVRADTTRAGTSFGFSTEQTSELTIQYMSTYWSRQFAVIDYPAFGMQGVGLFSYLYHEYVPAAGAACVQGQGLMSKRPQAVLRTSAMAAGLARGLALIPFTNDVSLHPRDGFEANVSQAYFSYAGVTSRFPEWLVYGETVPPLHIQVSNISTWLWRGQASDPKAVPYSLPAARIGSFLSQDPYPKHGSVVVSAW